MLCKVTHCAGHVSANTKPHQQHLRWCDREMGTILSHAQNAVIKIFKLETKLIIV